VHLVAHDWGSIQCWDALPEDRFGVLVSSYTSISGPSLDYASVWMRGLHRGARPRLVQLAESYYIGFFMTPWLPEALARRGFVDTMARLSSWIATPLSPPATADFERGPAETVNGIELYRANVPMRLLRPRPPKIKLPVQVIAPSHDIHVSAPLATQAPAPYVDDLTIVRIEGNHWVVSQRPVEVADLVRHFIDAVSARSDAPHGKDSLR